jgi:hypothetical protein
MAVVFRKCFGRVGARLLPIVEYSHLGLPPDLNREWAILDTFDMYSAVHDHPQSLATMRRCFKEVGMSEIEVRDGLNGVIACGRMPHKAEETCAALSV